MTTATSAIQRNQLELLYHISRELSSRIELRELIERILRLTSECMAAENGSLILVDSDSRVYDAALFVKGALVVDAAIQLGPQAEHGLAGWVLRERQIAILPDTTADPRWQQSNNGDSAASKSVLAAPLMYADRILGVLTLVHSAPSHFNDDNVPLVKAIAEQAAVAVENARLLGESRRQIENMRKLVEAAQVLSSTLDPDKVLHLLLTQTLDLLRLEAASIALTDVERQEIVFRVATGAAATKLVGLRLKLGQGIAGWVAQHGEAVIAPEAKSDPRFFAKIDQQTGFNTKAVLCAPIKFEGYIIGVLEGLNPAPGTFDRNTLPLLTAIASLAGNAIAHAQRFTFTEAAKTRYAGLFEDSFDPIIITDLIGAIIDVNHKAALALGYTRAEMIGKAITEIHPTGPFGADGLPDLSRGLEMTMEGRAKTKDGRDIPVEIHAKRISTPDYDFVQWIERDISERLQMEEMREDMTSMIFHDLRSPLGNVISSMAILETSIPPDDEMNHAVLAIAKRSGQHLSRLVDSLLDLRRLESGQAVLHKDEISVSVLALEAADHVHPLADAKNITLKFDLPLKLPALHVDVDMIKRVMINLLENSVKYMPGAGQVDVSARQEGDFILVSIQDNGLGIPEADRTRIFSKFTRLQRTSATKGMGLGLAFCRLAVEAHKGRIWVDPAPENGAIFRITLPTKTG